MIPAEPKRGDVWFVNFDPTIGHERAGARPALVISVDKFNHGPAGSVVVLPITSKDKRQPMHVPIGPPCGGLSKLSFIVCDNIRAVSKHRLRRFCGVVSQATMGDVEMRIRILLGL